MHRTLFSCFFVCFAVGCLTTSPPLLSDDESTVETFGGAELTPPSAASDAGRLAPSVGPLQSVDPDDRIGSLPGARFDDKRSQPPSTEEDAGLLRDSGVEHQEQDVGTEDDGGGAPPEQLACTEDEYRDGDTCLPLTACLFSEFEVLAATTTANRVCLPLTVCGDEEFASTAPTEQSDRVSSLLTTCTATGYEATPPMDCGMLDCVRA